MIYKNLLRAVCELPQALFAVLMHVQYELDRQLFFLTGIRTPLLRAVWEHQAERMQRRLDLQHGITNK